MDELDISKYGRPIVYVADVTWYGGAASVRGLFARRRPAVEWAKRQASLFSAIDWSSWTAPQGQYPYEIARDDETLTPTFVAKWQELGGGSAVVTMCEVDNNG